jgi:putative transposase
VRLITSDDHSSLKTALNTVFPSTPWQRCQFHLSQNAQSYVPKKHLRSEIAEAMKSIFNSPSLDMAEEMIKCVVKTYEKSAPEFTSWLEENVREGLTCYNFPKSHQKRIRTSNGIERVNREVKRRTRVAVLFPNKESALRLVTGIFMEIHEEWITGRQYLDMTELEMSDSVSTVSLNKMALAG